MKKSIFLTVAIIFTFSFSHISAQSECCNKDMTKTSYEKSSCDKNKTSMNTTKGEKEVSFKVSGQCEMCKSRIEKAALSISGVQTAEWDKTSKLLRITYNGDVSKKVVEKAIADIGHDTPDFKAEKEVYDALPVCCKYVRQHEKS